MLKSTAGRSTRTKCLLSQSRFNFNLTYSLFLRLSCPSLLGFLYLCYFLVAFHNEEVRPIGTNCAECLYWSNWVNLLNVVTLTKSTCIRTIPRYYVMFVYRFIITKAMGDCTSIKYCHLISETTLPKALISVNTIIIVKYMTYIFFFCPALCPSLTPLSINVCPSLFLFLSQMEPPNEHH